ncbi:MAG: site-specific integrase, partial [Pseudomonadota bacterium]
EGKAENTLRKKRWYLDMANADFANVPIRDLSSAVILKTLRKVEAKGNYHSAQRLRSTIGQVCRYAIATARLDNDPTYALRGALISPQVKHQPAITDKEGFSQVVRDVWAYGGGVSTNAALKLIVLLYPRPGELRKARWGEFDLDAATWTIPPEHEKNRRTHVKPLPELALEILRELKAHSGYGDLVFPTNSNPKKPLSENAINQALQRLGYKGTHTSHGFRASASSLLNESGLWNEDAIETELCHVERSQSRRPYNRAKYWDERVKMAEWWAAEIAIWLKT